MRDFCSGPGDPGHCLGVGEIGQSCGGFGALGMDAGFLPTSGYFGRMRGDYLNLLLA